MKTIFLRTSSKSWLTLLFSHFPQVPTFPNIPKRSGLAERALAWCLALTLHRPNASKTKEQKDHPMLRYGCLFANHAKFRVASCFRRTSTKLKDGFEDRFGARYGKMAFFVSKMEIFVNERIWHSIPLLRMFCYLKACGWCLAQTWFCGAFPRNYLTVGDEKRWLQW